RPPTTFMPRMSAAASHMAPPPANSLNPTPVRGELTMPLRRRGSMGNLSGGSPLCPVVTQGGGAGRCAMASEDKYQQRASECFRLAERSVEEKERNTWRELSRGRMRITEHSS